MNNIFLFSFVSLFIFQNVQASDLDCVEMHKIDPCCNLFEKDEEFSGPEENGVVLKVNFSGPIYEDAKFICFDDSSDSPQKPDNVKLLTKNSTFFDIISDRQCVGKVETDIMLSALNQVYIRHIKVHKEYRRQGFGSQAIDLVVQFYRQKRFEIESFAAQIQEGNGASMRVFEHNGFSTDGTLRLGLFAYVLKAQN